MPQFREPTAADAAAIATLLEELGHPAEAHEIPARLHGLRQDPRALAFVAAIEGRIVGLATAHVIDALHAATPVAMLTMLVVASDVRGQGIGREMVQHAERWATSHGAGRITLTSALHREAAHDFYKRLGYAHTGVRLARELARE